MPRFRLVKAVSGRGLEWRRCVAGIFWGESYDLGIFVYILPFFMPTQFPVKNPEKKALTEGKNPQKDSRPSRN